MRADDGEEPRPMPAEPEGVDSSEELLRAAESLHEYSKEAQRRRLSDEERNRLLAEALNKYTPGLMGFFYRQLPSWQDAEDAVQEVALRAYKSLWSGALNPAVVVSLRPTLWIIANNVRNDFYRRRARTGGGKNATFDANWQMPMSATMPAPDTDAVDAAMAFESVIAASKLGPKEELALRYKCIDGLEPRDMAAKYGGTANTWAAAVSAALRKVRKNVTKE